MSIRQRIARLERRLPVRGAMPDAAGLTATFAAVGVPEPAAFADAVLAQPGGHIGRRIAKASSSEPDHAAARAVLRTFTAIGEQTPAD